jgi:hypothetical protein
MRRVTRNFVLGVLAVVVVLLALGALPGLLKAGDPYYLLASPATADVAVNATDLPERRYPYATAALGNATASEPGRSGPYWRGPVGLKGAFTHSPFDELAALGGREPDATDGDAVFVRRNGTTYRLAAVQEGGA